MDDLKQRLRVSQDSPATAAEVRATMAEAAAALDALETTLDHWRKEWDKAHYAHQEIISEQEARISSLRMALESCPPTSNPEVSPEEHIERINAWWRLTARAALEGKE